MRLIEIERGCIIDVDRIICVVKEDLNKYSVILDGCPIAPNIDSAGYDIIIKTVNR